LDKAREHNRTEIIRLLAEHQVTTEFVHSILACDWRRASLIHQYQHQFIQINMSDAIHTLTWARTTHRSYAQPILQICLNTNLSDPFALIFTSSTLKTLVDVNSYCTDGLPFFFHMFSSFIDDEYRTFILSKANLHRKSFKGETFLFHLVHLYQRNENGDERYVTTFKDILEKKPIILAQRNEQGRTIIDQIELTSSDVYERLRPFYNVIKTILDEQFKNTLVCERFVMHSFGYHLLLFITDEHLKSNRTLQNLVHSVKVRQGLPALMYELVQTIVDDDVTKMQLLLKTQLNLVWSKDWSGRTCAHIAVLHGCRRILK
jgi:hypothetical protein